jgi:lipid-A-disaccharide synthase-like uncharacterized protein
MPKKLKTKDRWASSRAVLNWVLLGLFGLFVFTMWMLSPLSR